MKELKEKVITVRSSQKLYEVIESISFDSETFYFIHIERTLINSKELIESFPDHIFMMQKDGYEIEVAENEDIKYEWFWLVSLKKPNGEYHFRIAVDTFFDLAHGHYKNFQTIFIRKWGSKARMDED